MNRIAPLLLVTVSVTLTFIVAEAALRLFQVSTPVLEVGEVRPWETYIHEPAKNKLGFREADPGSGIFESGYKRILLLGDSFTFGHGVRKGEDRFSDLIEARLQREKPGGYKYHVYNAGVSSTEPRDWAGYLQQLLPLYRPDYVIAVFFLRDGTDLCTSLRCLEKLITDIKHKYTDNPFYRHTSIGRLWGDFRVTRRFSSEYRDAILNAYTGDPTQRSTWTEQQRYLLAMRDMCEQHGIPYHLIIFPMLLDLESGYRFQTAEDEISRFATQNRIPVYSLLPGFLGLQSSSLWVSRNDQHPNEKGHAIAAETLYPYLAGILRPTAR